MPFSSHKDVLEKLKTLHPLPGLILEWRRINNAITKVVFPLQREKRLNSALGMERIYPISQTHTATGEQMCANVQMPHFLLVFSYVCAAFLRGKDRKSSLCSTSTKQKYWCIYLTYICLEKRDVFKMAFVFTEHYYSFLAHFLHACKSLTPEQVLDLGVSY